jgi:hypothetical protein
MSFLQSITSSGLLTACLLSTVLMAQTHIGDLDRTPAGLENLRATDQPDVMQQLTALEGNRFRMSRASPL